MKSRPVENHRLLETHRNWHFEHLDSPYPVPCSDALDDGLDGRLGRDRLTIIVVMMLRSPIREGVILSDPATERVASLQLTPYAIASKDRGRSRGASMQNQAELFVVIAMAAMLTSCGGSTQDNTTAAQTSDVSAESLCSDALMPDLKLPGEEGRFAEAFHGDRKSVV